jgi:predicted RNA-binding protein (virulence factor B family)
MNNPEEITVENPTAGDCVYLKAITVTKAGAFMERAGESDLLIPVSQQLTPIVNGESYVVYLYLDPKQQLIGSTKLHKFLDERARNMAPGQAVDLLIVGRSELGYKAVIDGTHLGLIYADEVFQPLHAGEKTRGFIKSIRSDNKIDLSLQRHTKATRSELEERILKHLESKGGSSTLTDYSPPEAIYKQFKVSKKNYKRALGALYKQRLITVSKEKVTLNKS